EEQGAVEVSERPLDPSDPTQRDLGHQSCTLPSEKGDLGRWNSPCRMLRTTGAAVVEPWPPCSTMHTTTYLGSPAGAMAANHESGWCGATSAVPVFPATGTCESGNPRNAT